MGGIVGTGLRPLREWEITQVDQGMHKQLVDLFNFSLLTSSYTNRGMFTLWCVYLFVTEVVIFGCDPDGDLYQSPIPVRTEEGRHRWNNKTLKEKGKRFQDKGKNKRKRRNKEGI